MALTRKVVDGIPMLERRISLGKFTHVTTLKVDSHYIGPKGLQPSPSGITCEYCREPADYLEVLAGPRKMCINDLYNRESGIFLTVSRETVENA